eukprot:438740_1
MAQSSQQYYRNGFNTLSESRIKAFAQSFWERQNIHPTVPTHVGQPQFIERIEWLIVSELSRATHDFQRCIGDIWNSFQDHTEPKRVVPEVDGTPNVTRNYNKNITGLGEKTLFQMKHFQSALATFSTQQQTQCAQFLNLF